MGKKNNGNWELKYPRTLKVCADRFYFNVWEWIIDE